MGLNGSDTVGPEPLYEILIGEPTHAILRRAQNNAASWRIELAAPGTLILAPARLRVGVDAEGQLADYLVGEGRVGRVDPAEPRVAEQPLDPGGGEDAVAARQVESGIHHLPHHLRRPVFRRDDLHRPRTAVVRAVGPVLRDPVELRADALQ